MTDHKDHRPTRTTSGFMARSEQQYRANTAALGELIGFAGYGQPDKLIDFTRAEKVFDLTLAEENRLLFGLALALAIRAPRKMYAAAVAEQRKQQAKLIANAVQRTQLERGERDLRQQQPEGSAPHGN